MRPRTLAKRRLLAELWVPGTLYATTLSARLRPGLSDRSLRQARADCKRAGFITRSRAGGYGNGPVTWTIHKDHIDRRLIRHVYTLVVDACIERGERPPRLPWNFYRPDSPKHEQAMREYQYACDRADEIRDAIEDGANAGIDAKTAVRNKRQYDEGMRRYQPPPQAVRWTGPDIALLDERFPGGNSSFGVPY